MELSSVFYFPKALRFMAKGGLVIKKTSRYISLILLLTLATSLNLLSCGGGGGGGGGETTRISGNVADVMTAMAPIKEKPYMLALIKDFFSFSKKANAQGSEVEGIEVIA
ncbi:MAG TPA: hypothetical protein VFF49_01215, partial [Thermodesulfobacteriota bacterium]|nr:hypothetical protein [Thermodesulfobacteriota bacterium]